MVRFPDGTKEFRYPEKALEEGDVIWHDSKSYVVIHVSSDGAGRALVTVEPEPEDLVDTLKSEKGAVQLVPAD